MRGAAHGPLGCAAPHTRAVLERLMEAPVMWGRVPTPGSGMAAGMCQASTPSLMQRWSQGPSGFPWGWYSTCLLSRWRRSARHHSVPIVPWAVPEPSLGTPALFGQVGRQTMCPPGDGTGLQCCHAHPRAALLGPDSSLHALTRLASALVSSCADGKCKFNMFSFSDS